MYLQFKYKLDLLLLFFNNTASKTVFAANLNENCDKLYFAE